MPAEGVSERAAGTGPAGHELGGADDVLRGQGGLQEPAIALLEAASEAQCVGH